MRKQKVVVGGERGTVLQGRFTKEFGDSAEKLWGVGSQQVAGQRPLVTYHVDCADLFALLTVIRNGK